MTLDSYHRRLVTQRTHTRLFIVVSALCFFLGMCVFRTGYLCVAAPKVLAKMCVAAVKRGDIVDQQGVVLATSIPTHSVYLDLREVSNPLKVLKDVASRVDTSLNVLKKRFLSARHFLWLKRHVSPQEKQILLEMGIPGMHFVRDYKRLYTLDRLCAHVVGLTDIDGNGIMGLEKTFDARLRKGQSLRLSLLSYAQTVVCEELESAIETFQAKAGNALILRVDTGEIVAMASYPSFNPNAPVMPRAESAFNRNVSGVYEFGSILKIHNMAMAFESGAASLHSVYDASAPIRLGRFTITDFRGKNRPMTAREGFLFSSNIVNAKMAVQAGKNFQQRFLKSAGLFDAIELELPEKARCLVPKTWSDATNITVSYGYGLSVTPLHMVQSIAAIVTGYKRPLTLLARDCAITAPRVAKQSLLAPKRVLSDQTVATMRHLLESAVREGQAKRGQVCGYRVGGKTGTANQLVGKHYQKGNNLTSFVAVFPIEKPEYVILVSLASPKPNASTGGFATAGMIAAPIGRKILSRLMPRLFPNKHEWNASKANAEPAAVCCP